MLYRIFEEKLTSYDDEDYITYGIECDKYNIKVSDITTNKEKLISFTNMLNEGELSPVHLMDVVEDNINELI